MLKQSLFVSGLALTGLVAVGCDEAGLSGALPSVTPTATQASPDDSPAVAPAASVDPSITDDLQAGRPREVIVVLSEEPAARRAANFHAAIPNDAFASYLAGVQSALDGQKADVLAAAASAGGLATLHSYEQLPVMHVRVESAAALAALAAQPNVVAVVEDRGMQAFDLVPADLSLVGQPAAAAAGKLGAGTTVAVLDTGTDFTRAPFNCTAPGQPAGCPVVVAQDFAAADGVADSSPFHGTNVSGIVLSMAPAAKIAALDVFDGSWAYTSTILSAINWCILNKAKYNIVAINMSLGGGLFGSACSLDPFAPSIAAARAAGIVTAVASGNSASATGISSPACAPAAVSVGAVYAANVGPLYTSVCNDLSSAADQVACFSNSASFLTILAPGVGITAAGVTMSGTSQATPHVAGAIAVLAGAFPTAGPDALIARLTRSNAMITDKRNKVTTPRLDLGAALATTSVTAPTGTVVINGGAAYTKSTAVTVAVTAQSGTATQICLSATTTCQTWKTYASSVPFTLATGDGAKKIYVWWKAANGTASPSPVSASIVLDTTAPTNVAVVASLSGTTATLAWTPAIDVGSGLASYKVVTGLGSAPASCNVGTSIYSGTAIALRISSLPVGTTYFRVCAIDKLGTMNGGTAVSVRRAK